MTNSAVPVLLVEDSVADAQLVARMLRRVQQPRYEVDRVATMAEAEAAVASGRHEVILLDLELPDSSREETVARMIAAADGRPIVVLTGLDEEALGHACVDSGAQDFMAKDGLHPPQIRRRIEYARLRGRRRRAMDDTLAHYRQLVDEQDGAAEAVAPPGVEPDRVAVTGAAAPVLSRAQSAELTERYTAALHAYLLHLHHEGPKPAEEMRAVAAMLYHLHAGRSELVRLQLKALQRESADLGDERSHALAVEGRHFALEMMGLLLECYRCNPSPDA